MSFVDTVDLESQIPYSDSPEFDQLNERISSSLFDINASLGTLHSHLKALGKPNASQTIEERAVSLAEDVRNRFRDVGELVKEMAEWERGGSGEDIEEREISPAQKFTQQKLTREFSAALSEFQEIQRDLAERQRKSVVLAKEKQQLGNNKKNENLAALEDEGEEEGNDDDDDYDAELAQQQQQEQELLNQHELEYQSRLILERESEIHGIEQGIEELNEIFSDLGRIVTEQGAVIDNIEANVYNVAGSTRMAAQELNKAAKYQRSSRGRALCLLIILVVILAVILLAALI